ncbi:MAG: Do family serine endopeptidase [Fuerstiella sp.]|nr:Do family serine endopeptidase [Fuerstiella sp.]
MKLQKWPSVLLVGAATFLAVGITHQLNGTNYAAAQTQLQRAETQNSPAFSKAYELSDAFRQVSKHTLPAVVSIKTRGKVVRQTARRSPFGNDPLMRQFFDDPRFRDFLDQQENGREREYRMPGGQGSGFIIDSSGVILTNNHVVDDAEEIIIELADGREFTVVDVKTDPRSDVAVLKIETKEELPILVLGDDEQMEIGDWVLAFGSPFGLNRSVTQGIISAKGRGMTSSSLPQEFLQTDAAINPGNSGGPLVNLRGEVVGINTAISTRSGGYDGVSLAIPASHAKWVANQLRNTGEVRRAYVGITMQELNADLAKAFDLKIPRGVVVTGVVKDSPAAQAGFREGDVILEVDGRRIANDRNMLGVVERLTIGQKYEIKILRDGRERNLKITVAERPNDLSGLENNESDGGPASEDEQSAEINDVGISIQNLTEDLVNQLGMSSSSGVVITSVESNSAADDAGLEAGMVIARVGNRTVNTIAEMENAMKTARQAGRALFLVKVSRGNSSVSRFVTIKLTGQDRN